MTPNPDAPARLASFQQVMRRLLSPDGCPWDREQTHDSLKRYLIEEAYEVYEAIEEGADDRLQDELGDVLLQVVFHSALAERDGRFTLADVIRGVEEKMVRRHPHVFADVSVDGARDVEVNWEEIKKAEKGQNGARSRMDVPKAMDPLYRAEKLQKRAAKVGFDWPDATGVQEKLREELQELGEALDGGDADAIREETGDLLFSVVNLARKAGVDPVDALQAANDKFVRRFRSMERSLEACDEVLRKMAPGEWERAWWAAKQAERPENKG